MKKFLHIIAYLASIIAVIFFASSLITFADWSAPIANPPTCATGNPGCDPPLNTNLAGQIKSGGLTVANNSGVVNGLVVRYGNVGIGNFDLITTFPQAKLDVTVAGVGPQIAAYFNNSDTGVASSQSRIVFGERGSGASTLWYQGISGAYNSALPYMGFSVNNVANTWSEKMRITYSGNVGIGDASPLALLTVGSGDLFQVDSSGNVSLSGGGTLTIGSRASDPTGAPGRTYYNTTSQKLRCYEISWVDCIGASGGGTLTGGGTTNTIPLWTGISSLGNSVITQSGSNISIAGSMDVSNNITAIGAVNVGSNVWVTQNAIITGYVTAQAGYVQPGIGGERLKTIRGSITCGRPDLSPLCIKGTGYTLTRLNPGQWRINYSTCFADIPSVTGSIVTGLNARIFRIRDLTYTNCYTEVLLEDSAGANFDASFQFIATGPVL